MCVRRKCIFPEIASAFRGCANASPENEGKPCPLNRGGIVSKFSGSSRKRRTVLIYGEATLIPENYIATGLVKENDFSGLAKGRISGTGYRGPGPEDIIPNNWISTPSVKSDEFRS